MVSLPFSCHELLAVDKAPKADWEVILPDIKAVFLMRKSGNGNCKRPSN